MGRTLSFDRDEALHKAMLLFWKNGYQATSLKQLESHLALRPGSLYHSFGNKDRLFMEALELYASEFIAQLQAAVEAHDSLTEALEVFITGLLVEGESVRPSRACLVVKTLFETSDAGGVVAEKADALLAEMETQLVTLVDAEKAAGRIPESRDSTAIARQIQVSIIGLRGIALRSAMASEIRPLVASVIRNQIH